LISLAVFAVDNARAQTPRPSDDSFAGHHTRVSLMLSAVSARPGDTIWAGVDMKMDAGWHTYWKNPGSAGMPTAIVWHLPDEISAGEIQWPLPEKLPPVEVTTYGYENEVMLAVPLTLPANLPDGRIDFKAGVSWLECKQVCVPGSTTVDAALNIGPETKASTNAPLIQSWKDKAPRSDNNLTLSAWWETAASGDTRSLIIEGRQTAGEIAPDDKIDFFPDTSDQFEVQGATEKIPEPGGFGLRKEVKKFSGDWPKEISGVMVVEGKVQRTGFNIMVPIADKAAN
jgi:thiol:disulfide interchange protein DsbD